MKTFLRWAGSKKQIAARILGHWPGPGVRYVEPFAGSACVFFRLEPTKAILGDLNWELIATFRAVRDDAPGVLRRMSEFTRGRRSYYRVRRTDPSGNTNVEVAARFIYLNRYCFNGLYRTNTVGTFNVPYGPPKHDPPSDSAALLDASRVLAKAHLVHGDFETTLSLTRTGDFVYLDPPYVVSTRRVFSGYTPGSFSPADLARLGAALREIDKRGVRFVISYADSPEARGLLGSWRPRRIRVRRNIAGFAGNRRESYELLVTNMHPLRGRDAD